MNTIKISMPFLIFILLSFSGCSKPEATTVVETKARAVKVETIASRDLPIVVHAAGRLTANREVDVSAQVAAILMAYEVDVGSRVAQGEAMVRLDAADYTLALNEAQANLQAAQVKMAALKNKFERAKRLLPDRAITPELFDQCEADYKSSVAHTAQMKSMLALAKRRLNKTIIKAPFSGYVTQRYVEIGQNVAAGDPVMRIADMKTMRVKININELEYVHLDKGDPVQVTVEAFSQAPMAGHVDKIGIQADSRTNTFEVEILVDNTDFNLKAGLTARVTIQTEMIQDAVMIAQNTVLFRGSGQEVFVVEAGNIAAVRKVTMGRVDGSQVCILDGLNPGDRLVVAGGQYLKPGDTVVIEQ